mmetsp:Transcript_10631/g.23478  ORF Transcript_10631/g.23478 Transcript_10631/m.23478 type:complete len:140 (+) Transcript_10631:180-599(+)|eukprot:CAMPEP_0172297250 /NCGR_PEP_ID=MMETSP1058-20130122/348_1 /TAXON_ID=83371 /ORGANISM="Detonula confervacea, Strain CCMP 353" /LENGTH=139 /DNA_ID=CAMNT_0013006379 /DNA_START=77 /DNA_END=496 /DNA_ORIENTATION=-
MRKRLQLAVPRRFRRILGTAATTGTAIKRRGIFFFHSLGSKSKQQRIYGDVSIDSGLVRNLENDLEMYAAYHSNQGGSQCDKDFLDHISTFDESQASTMDWSESYSDYTGSTYSSFGSAVGEEDIKMACTDIILFCGRE